MASITVKNIPEPLLQRLRKVAAESNRSLNRQIIECLERQLMPRRTDVDTLLDQIRGLRARGPKKVGINEIDRARREGRE